MESKQNGSTYSPAPRQVGLSAMKRKVPFTPENVVVSIFNDFEFCYVMLNPHSLFIILTFTFQLHRKQKLSPMKIRQSRTIQ